jgi:hypothetical protein
MLTTHPYLQTRLRMFGAIPLLPIRLHGVEFRLVQGQIYHFTYLCLSGDIFLKRFSNQNSVCISCFPNACYKSYTSFPSRNQATLDIFTVMMQDAVFRAVTPRHNQEDLDWNILCNSSLCSLCIVSCFLFLRSEHSLQPCSQASPVCVLPLLWEIKFYIHIKRK